MKIKHVLIQDHRKNNSCDDILSNLSSVFIKEGYETKVLNNKLFFWRKMKNTSDLTEYRKEAIILIRKGEVMVVKSSTNRVEIIWNISVLYLLIFSFIISLTLTFMCSQYFEIEFVNTYIVLVLFLITSGFLGFYLKTRSVIKKSVR